MPQIKNKKRKRKPRNLDKDRQAFRKAGKRHVLKIECDMSEDNKRHAFHMAESLRKFYNLVVRKAGKRMDQVYRRKKHKQALAVYRETKDSTDPEDIKRKKEAARQMKEIRQLEGLTPNGLYNACKGFARHLKIPSPFALKIVENVFRGVESIMFGKGKKLHFRGRFDFPLLGAKSIKSAIIPRVEDGEIIIKTAFTGDFKLKLKKNDTFQREELEKVIEFLTNPEIEAEAVKKFKETGQLTDTFRICYISLKCEEIRGKLRVFALFTLEGAPLPKKKRNGKARHHLGTGEAGLDLGTQSRAVYGDNIISFENLAERNGRSTFKAEEKEAKLQRKMEASLRAMNPQNYNKDGSATRS